MPRWFRPTLTKKFALLFALTLLFWVGNALVVHSTLAQLSGLGETLDVAGSLRWRSRQIEVDALRLSAGSEVERSVLAQRIDTIGRAIDALARDDTAAAEASPVVSADDVAAVRQSWLHLQKDVEEIVATAQPASDAMLERLHADSEQFLSLANAMVSSLARRSDAIQQANRMTLYKLAFADLLVVLTAFLVMRVQVVRPLLHLARVTQDFSRGEFGCRTGYRARDEIGLLAESFDHMADETEKHIRQIEADLASMQRNQAELRKFSEAIAQSPNVILITNAEGTIEYANPRISTMIGYEPSEVIGRNPRMWRADDTPADVHHELWETIRAGKVWRHELLNRRKNGEVFWDSTSISPVRGEDGEISHFVAVKEDITERKRAEEMLRLRERAIASSINGVVISKASRSEDNPLIYANPAFCRITGYAEHELIGRNPRFLIGDDWNQPEIAALRHALHTGAEARVVLRNYRKDGSLIWVDISLAPVHDEAGTLTHFISVFGDVTDRMRYEAELEHQATHDALTGLPNRSLMRDRIDQAIARAHRDHGVVGIAFIDLDHFKYVNDSLGHMIGDELVKAFATRLSACVRASDTLARQGGDEFVLVMSDAHTGLQIGDLLARVIEQVTGSYVVGPHEIHATCSVGVSQYPRDGRNAETLLRNADTAMYRAKESGRNRVEFYREDMNARLERRVLIEAGLRNGLAGNELFLEYQPKLDLLTGGIVGAEALLRWRHPRQGVIAPAQFIPVAEETGLIVPIGEWAIGQVCAQLAAWRDAGLSMMPVAVNLSASQFRNERLVDTLLNALRDHDLDQFPPIEMEITESMLMDEVESALPILHRLKDIGIALSLDDFGTGYSSLAYLKRLPIDHLKIDRAFVRDLNTDPEDAAICRTIISLAHNLKCKVIAEGIETEAQMHFLRRHHCDHGQGYYFSRPLPPGDLVQWLAFQRSVA